jgi:hydrogenase maturation factor
VLVQVGLAVEKIDEAEAQETMRLLEEIREAFEQAVAPPVGEEDEP